MPKDKPKYLDATHEVMRGMAQGANATVSRYVATQNKDQALNDLQAVITTALKAMSLINDKA